MGVAICYIGADTVRFKAEVNFDGREVTKVHISRLDLEKILLVCAAFINILPPSLL